MKAEYETFMNITRVRHATATSETGSFGGNRRRKKNIAEVTSMFIGKLQIFEELVLGETQMLIGGQILKEIRARIKFLCGWDLIT